MSKLKVSAIHDPNNDNLAIGVDSSGNVGIGTSSPSYKLTLEDSSDFAIHLLKTSVADGWIRNTGNLDIAAASGGSSSQVITFSTGANYAGLTERMRIDGTGNITTPYNVAFYAVNSGTGSQQGDGFLSNPAQFVNVVLNRGNGYNNSTHRFTAPVTGLYTFTGNPGYKQSGVDFAVRLKKNGTDVTDVIRLIGGNNSHSGLSFGCTIYLAANDYVELNMAAAGSYVYHRNNSSVPNWFAGYLVG